MYVCLQSAYVLSMCTYISSHNIWRLFWFWGDNNVLNGQRCRYIYKIVLGLTNNIMKGILLRRISRPFHANFSYCGFVGVPQKSYIRFWFHLPAQHPNFLLNFYISDKTKFPISVPIMVRYLPDVSPLPADTALCQNPLVSCVVPTMRESSISTPILVAISD